MSGPSERLQAFQYELTKKQNAWRANVGLPYAIAYGEAHHLFTQTMTAQKDADTAAARAQAELFVLAASIVTGSFLMAAVASSSLRVLAGRAALHVLSRSRLDGLYKNIARTDTYRAGVFATGKIIDHVQGELKKEITDRLAKLHGETSNIVSASPLVRGLQIEEYLAKQVEFAYAVAEAIERSRTLNDGQKNAAFAALGRAPLLQEPPRTRDQKSLAEKIELSFYMKVILETDELVRYPPHPFGAMSPRMPQSREPIPQIPGAGDYPRSTQSSMTWTGMSGMQSVTVRPTGDLVERRVDALHKSLFHVPYFQQGGGWGSNNGRTKAGLHSAVPTLRRLAEATGPRHLSDVRV